MKIYKNFAEMFEDDDAPEEVFLELRTVLSQDEFGEYDVFANTFTTLLGGNVYIVEAYDDLKDVMGLSPLSGAHYISLLDGVPIFDCAFYLASEQWMMFMLATNNAGGNSYYVPRSVFADSENAIKAAGTVIKTARGEFTKVSRIAPISCLPVERYIPISQETYRRWQAGALPDGAINLTRHEITFLKTGVVTTEAHIAEMLL